MIELLTGKHPQNLEDPITGELRWRNRCNVNPRLADLLDEMVNSDVRSRPAHAAIIQKRLLKIVPAALQPNLITQLNNAVIQSVTQFTQAVSSTTLFTVQAIFKFLLACLATIWAIILGGIGASLGTIAGFILAYQTKFGTFISEFISLQLSQLIQNSQPTSAKEILVFAIAGLGTAWGITVSGSFGQKRRFLVAALMGLIGYSLGWVAWQFITPHNSAEGLVAWMLVSISMLTLGLGLRTHYLAYAFIAAFGSANILAALIHLGLPVPTIHFSNQPGWLELFTPLAFFGFTGILISLCLGLSYYLIVPCLRWLGWR